MELDNQEKMKQSMECGIYIFLYDSLYMVYGDEHQ